MPGVTAIVSNELAANWLGALAASVATVQREATAAAGSDSRVAALLTLREFPETPVGELATVLNLTHSACVRLADALVADGLVHRTRGERDMRQVRLVLTAAGRRAADRLQRSRLRAIEEILAPLEADQRAQLAGLIAGVLRGTPRDRITARRACRHCAHRICTGSACPIGGSISAHAG